MFASTISMIMGVFNFMFFSNFLWDFIYLVVLFFSRLIVSCTIVFYVKLNSSEFDYISSI